MTHLGALGTEKEPVEVEEISFEYFGETIRANPDLSQLDYVDFLHIAGGLDVDNPVSFGAIKDFASVCIVAEDFPRFWKLAKKHRQDIDDLFGVCTSVMEAVTERPTGLPSGSADGPTSTGSRFEDGDLSRALKAVEGRADLELFVSKQAVAG